MTTIEQTYQEEASLFLEKLFFELRSLSINYSNWDIDHLCFRTETLSHYEQIKKDFSTFSTLLIESPVNGRPIATYKLEKPWRFGENFIDLIEVPAPKPNKTTRPGFEHIEVVMPKSFEEIQKLYPTLSFEHNQHHKDFNPELVANLKGGDLKFHHQSLEVVINIEKMEGILENILHKFNFPKIPFFITGTHPIGTALSTADIDIVVSYSPQDQVKLLEWIQSFQEKVQNPRLQIQNDVMIFRFIYDQLLYEFYMSPEPLFQQNAYRHMNIEMRLLKIFGSSLREKVMISKNSGANTEYAFLHSLGIKTSMTDAFQDIYQLESWSDLKISSLELIQ